MRLFIGIDFEDRQKNNLKKMQKSMAAFLESGNTVDETNMHCTLLFLGEIPIEKTDEISNKLCAVAKRNKPFMTGFWDTAHFANGCAVVKLKAHKNFITLQSDIETELQQFAAKPTIKYVPHTTLYRNAKFNMPFREVKKNVPILNFPFEINNLTLFDSARGKKGMIYTPLTFFKLEG